MDYQELLKKAKKNLPEPSNEERFEVPQPIVIKNKKQTIIRNFMEIVKTLRRDPKHLAKFLFKELAAPGSVTANGELVLQGKLHPSMVRQRLGEYVKSFVVCSECGKPDTSMKADGRIVTLKCEACGAKRTFRG